MLGSAPLADVGCDHGKLCAFLLQNGRIGRSIGMDISLPSLQKAMELRDECALSEKWELREGSGLRPLESDEAGQLSFCGMGGELIAELLEDRPSIAKSAERIIMQPMGGASELRAYLYSHEYEIFDEALVRDSGRIYQLIAARSGNPRKWPDNFPKDCFNFGIVLFEKHDPLLLPLLLSYRESHQRRLNRAHDKGRDPAALLRIIEQTDILIQLAKGEIPL